MQPADELEETPAHLPPEAARAYLDARTQGLCHEGALEVASGVAAAAPREDRLDAVEFKLAHLERAVQELSDVMYAQQRQIDGLLRLQRGLREELEQLLGRTDDAAPVELPPHY